MLRLLGIKDAAQLVELLKDDHELDDIFAKFDDILKMNKSDVTYESTINGVVYQMRKRPAVNAEGNLIGIMLYGHDITKLKYVVPGGKNGQDSIRNGVYELEKHFCPDDIVLIHDDPAALY